MFAAGVWTFSKGGVEGGGEVDLFLCIVLDICKREVLNLKLKENLDILGRLYIVKDIKINL